MAWAVSRRVTSRPGGVTLLHMPQTPLSRRRFLQSVAAAAAAGPFLSFPTRASGATLRHASVGGGGPGVLRPERLREAPGLRARRRGRCRSLPHGAVAAALPQGPRLSGLARAAQEGAREHRFGERLDPRSHALPVALEAMKLGKPVYVQKPLCNTLRETRRLTEEARRRGLTTQMGIQVSSSRPQRYGEASSGAGSSGRFGKSTPSRTRAGVTTSRCRPRSIRCPPPSPGTTGLA